MKLKDFVLHIYDKGFFPNGEVIAGLDHPLYGDKLQPLADEIRSCEEFQDCKIVDFVTIPILKTAAGHMVTAQTIKLGGGVRFKGRCFILSVSLTPEMFDPKDLHYPIKDNALITPTLYNHKDLTPYRNIILKVSPYDLVKSKDEIHQLLDKILDEPKEYIPKGKRDVMVRGFFDVDKSKVTKDDFEHTVVSFYEVFYLKRQLVNAGEVGLGVASTLIPKEYKDKFLESFGEKSIILEEELIKFREENKIQEKWQ